MRLEINSFFRRKSSFFAFSILLLGAFLRFYLLDLKPLHFDEGVNGHFLQEMWRLGGYNYDPYNYHGPLFFYLLQWSELIGGVSVLSMRFVPALFSLMTISLFLAWGFRAKEKVGVWSALFMAVSPGMIFFSRSAIHESVFVFFQVLFFLGVKEFFFYFFQTGKGALREGWWCGVIGFFGMVVTKETYVITFFSVLIALLACRVPWGGVWREARSNINLQKNLIYGVALGFFSWLLLYSQFLTDILKLEIFFYSLAPWVRTGFSVDGHQKDFFYWFNLFLEYEWAGSLALLLSIWGLVNKRWQVRFTTYVALINFLLYSLIPYKTPWCIMSILWPFLILLSYMICFLEKKWLVILLVSLSVGYSVPAAWQLNFYHYEDPDEPYVYVQTRKEFSFLINHLKRATKKTPSLYNMNIFITAQDLWPLPWFLNRFHNIKYLDINKKNNEQMVWEQAALVIGDKSQELNSSMNKWKENFIYCQWSLRDGREPIFVLWKRDIFEVSFRDSLLNIEGCHD